ncbi:LysR family transcriptional regulator [Pokkaliibacter sp. CJK22405]|uniref:LysR family transcriptional regulator n=1 Tax=Pokkaliibacter sp. CJK22405 TaxID=3384615 RepID=UPI0039853B8E
MADPDFNLLVALDALLKEASVAGAARRLGLSESAMSRTLSRLRDTTGDSLLVRAGRTMVLTPYAESLREQAHQAVLDARTVLSAHRAEFNPATLERTFTIRANEGFIEVMGPRLILAMQEQAPKVRVRFTLKQRKESRPLREGDVDLEVGVIGDMGPEIRVQALYRDHFVAIMRAGHPLLVNEPTVIELPKSAETLPAISPESYCQYPQVEVSRYARFHSVIDTALAEVNRQRTVVSIVPSYPAAVAMILNSDMIAAVPWSYIANHPLAQSENRGITVKALPVSTPEITISQLWHPRLEHDPAHRWLRGIIKNIQE